MVVWKLNAFIVIALLCVLMVQVITATVLLEALKQLVARIEQEKKVTEYYEKIEEITQLTLDHANAVEKENEKLRKETEVIAQTAAELQKENRRFREGCKGDEI